MQIVLFSADSKLFELCREVACSIPGDDCEVVLSGSKISRPAAADLVIWDLEDRFWTDPEPHPGPHHGSNEQLFLVSRKHLQAFVQTLPLGVGTTVLKPVTAGALRIFIEQAMARVQGARDSGQTGSDRQDLLQYLLLANLKLQEYDQDRTNFLARAVHDFRSPLTAASGYCGLLQGQILGPLNADQLDILDRMQHSLKKLTRMASAMFQLSISRNVDRCPELKEAAIEACINHALREIAPVAGEKKIEISANFTDPGAPLYLEPPQIEQVLVNLLENACRFTPRGGQIEVRGYAVCWPFSCRRSERARDDARPSSPTGYRIDVQDTGTGIPQERLQDVFEEYTSYRGPDDRSGGGLGLAICKIIVAAHGGEIWAANDTSGAKVSLVLPFGSSGQRGLEMKTQARALESRAAS